MDLRGNFYHSNSLLSRQSCIIFKCYEAVLISQHTVWFTFLKVYWHIEYVFRLPFVYVTINIRLLFTVLTYFFLFSCQYKDEILLFCFSSITVWFAHSFRTSCSGTLSFDFIGVYTRLWKIKRRKIKFQVLS